MRLRQLAVDRRRGMYHFFGEWRRWALPPVLLPARNALRRVPGIAAGVILDSRRVRAGGGIDPSYLHCMDADLMTKFAVCGAKFRFVKQEFAAFRKHPASKTSTLGHEMRAEVERISAGLPKRNFLYRAAIRSVLRVWHVLYDIRDGRGRYLLGRLLNRCHRYLR